MDTQYVYIIHLKSGKTLRVFGTAVEHHLNSEREVDYLDISMKGVLQARFLIDCVEGYEIKAISDI